MFRHYGVAPLPVQSLPGASHLHVVPAAYGHGRDAVETKKGAQAWMENSRKALKRAFPPFWAGKILSLI